GKSIFAPLAAYPHGSTRVSHCAPPSKYAPCLLLLAQNLAAHILFFQYGSQTDIMDSRTITQDTFEETLDEHKNGIPDIVIGRLPVYLRTLKLLAAEGQ